MDNKKTNRKRGSDKNGEIPVSPEQPYTRMNDVASATECTGLTQFVPDGESECESFREVYDIALSGEDGKPGEKRPK